MAWWVVVAHLALVMLLLRLLLRPLLHHLLRLPSLVDELLLPHQTYTIPKFNDSLQENPLHRAATTFLSSLPSLHDSPHSLLLLPSSSDPSSSPYLRLSTHHPIRDLFLNSPLTWTLLPDNSLQLRLRRHDRHRLLRPYLQHIQAVAAEIDLTRQNVRLFVNNPKPDPDGRLWRTVPFTHPATLDTLAMDADLKSRVTLDLEGFLKNRAYYHRLGRVWKRSYLLHGPAGTGKSTFIAAMARHLRYDLYDLDLGLAGHGSGSYSDLKTLLLQTSPRSVIVVEDLDRHLPALPDLLGLVDGLFSCCGEERVLVFTMRGGGDAVDPALLRPGRVDVHLHFPLCDFTAFKAMASSYLGLKDHKLYPAVEEIFMCGAAMSPAEIGEIMIAHRGSPSRALKTVISALQQSTAGAARRVGLAFGSHRRQNSDTVAVGGSEEEEEKGNSDGGGVLGASGTINKEFRKLYGLIRRGSRREGGGGGLPPPAPLQLVPTVSSSGTGYTPENHSRELST